MDLKSFFLCSDQIIDKNVFIFTSEAYTPVFYAILVQQSALRFQNRLIALDLNEQNVDQIQGELTISFLGQSYLYWFGNVSLLPSKKLDQLLEYVRTYKGPHRLIFFIDKQIHVEESGTIVLIQVPQKINFEFSKYLYMQLYQVHTLNRAGISLLQHLFKQVAYRPLDQVIIIFQYIGLISTPHIRFFIDHWINQLMSSEYSLFMLSSYFFAQQAKVFFSGWNTIAYEYPDQFWITYWSDQLFRAFLFVHFAKRRKFSLAKKYALRLPFSFIKKDWQHYHATELCAAHDFLYSIDYYLKNGGGPYALDLFYTKFLNRDFKQASTYVLANRSG